MPKPPETHIHTDHLLTDLSRRVVSGGFVTVTVQVFKFALNIGSAIVLARLLSPRDFGLVAMAGALMPILRTFREGGLSTATVQKENITHAQVSNLFWISLVLGSLITLTGVALAPAIAWFYKDDRLTLVTILLSLTFILNGAAVQHLALLSRQMRFKAAGFIDITSATLGFLVGVFLARSNFGYWSLVGMQLTVGVTELALIWLVSGWIPQLPKLRSGTRPLLHFGASMTFYILMKRLAGSLDIFLLGRYYGSGPVGLYSRAGVLLIRPLDQFIAPFDTVLVPILSRLQNQPERYRQVFLQSYSAIALLSFTFAGLLIGLSDPLVRILLGSQWIGVIPIFSWSTISALFIPMSMASMWLLTTQGRSRDLLTIGVVVTIFTAISVVVGLPFGATGLALSLALTGLLIRLPIQYYLTGKSGPVTRSDLFRVFFRHLPLWCAVGGVTKLVQLGLSSNPPLTQLIAGGMAGSLVAVISIVSWPPLRIEALFIFEKIQRFIRSPKTVSA